MKYEILRAKDGTFITAQPAGFEWGSAERNPENFTIEVKELKDQALADLRPGPDEKELEQLKEAQEKKAQFEKDQAEALIPAAEQIIMIKTDQIEKDQAEMAEIQARIEQTEIYLTAIKAGPIKTKPGIITKPE